MRRTIRLGEAIDSYESWRRARGKAEGTIRREQAVLDHFLTATGNIQLGNLETRHVDSYFEGRSHLAPGTCNVELSALRSFLHYTERRGMGAGVSVLGDYGLHTKEPKVRRRVPVGDFPALLDAAENARDRILVALGLYCFLRASEIKMLRVKDVNLDTGELAVSVPKTHDADIMPISRELDTELRRWLVSYADRSGPLDPEWFLVPATKQRRFVRDEGGRIVKFDGEPDYTPTRPVREPARYVKRALAFAGWPDSLVREGCHTLRHSGARALYDELVDRKGSDGALEIVSAMLHHRELATTQHYLGLVESRRKRDDLLRGTDMFPSLSDKRVVTLGVRDDVGHGRATSACADL